MRTLTGILSITILVILLMVGFGIFINSTNGIMYIIYLCIIKNIFPIALIGIACYSSQLKFNKEFSVLIVLLALILIGFNTYDALSIKNSPIPLINNSERFLNIATGCNFENTICNNGTGFLNGFLKIINITLVFSLGFLATFMIKPNNQLTRYLRGITAISICTFLLYTLWILRRTGLHAESYLHIIHELKSSTALYNFSTVLPMVCFVTLTTTSISNYILMDRNTRFENITDNQLKKSKIIINESLGMNAVKKQKEIEEQAKKEAEPKPFIVPMEDTANLDITANINAFANQGIPLAETPVAIKTTPIENTVQPIEKPEQMPIESTPKEEIKVESVIPETPIEPVIKTPVMDIVAKPIITNLPGIDNNSMTTEQNSETKENNKQN